MKNLLILGAGTAGTMIARKMAGKLDSHDWKVILVDKDEKHYYQPGFLFLPFGRYKAEDVIKTKREFIPGNVEFILSDIEVIEPAANKVKLTKDNRVVSYDYLVIATGASIHPEETEGLQGLAGTRISLIFIHSKARLPCTPSLKNGKAAGWL